MSGPAAAGRGTAGALADGYDAVLFDLDGVLYVGSRVVPAAPDAVRALRDRGGTVSFVTNNASRTPAQVADRLTGFGIPAEADQVVTSAQAAAKVLADELAPGSTVLVVGAPALADQVAAAGLRPVGDARDRPAALVVGYWPGTDYALLAEAALAIRGGAWWLATNLDSTVPSERGLLPGNGSTMALLSHATGRRPDATAGKPDPPLLDTTLDRLGTRRALFVGDRLDTDIAGAAAVGLDSALVLTGVADPAQVLAARPQERPTFLLADVAGLLQPAPQVTTAADGSRRCGGWTARVEDGAVLLDGSGDDLDALQVAARAAWSLTGDAAVEVRGAPW